jgi:hypothetical protein
MLCFLISSGSLFSGYIGIPFGYNLPASSGGYILSSIPGICSAVKAITWKSLLSRKNTLKLWKSLPAAPMIITFDFEMENPPNLTII